MTSLPSEVEELADEAADLWTGHREAAAVVGSSPPATVPLPIAGRSGGAGIRRAAFLALVGTFMTVVGYCSMLVAHLLVDGVGLTAAYVRLSLVPAFLVGVMTVVDRPDRQRAVVGYLEEWVEAGRQVLISVVLLVIVGFFWRPLPISQFSFSRGTVLAFIPVGFVLIGLGRSLTRTALIAMRQRGHNLASIVVIGESTSASSFIDTLAAKKGSGYRVVEHIRQTDVPALERALHKICQSTKVDEVVIASPHLLPEHLQAVLGEPGMRQVRVRAVPELFGLPPSKVQVVDFADFPLFTLYGNPVRGPHWLVKRAIDVLVSAAALLVLSPVVAAITLLVRFTSEGPVLFRQERVGMDGKLFQVLKFRTMYANSSDSFHRELMARMLTSDEPLLPAVGGFFKPTDDPRVTRIGRALRRLSLDELPQLFNVLRGDMSLVGPRPALAYEVALYEDWQRRRLDVLPGMTGLWQVSGRSRLSPADMLRLDVHYAETWSLPKDLLIILRTLPALLRDDSR